MGAGHAHLLHLPHDSAVHRLPPEVKIAASVGFTLLVVLTPREAMWAFGVYALLLAIVVAAARVRPGWLLRRVVIELPFVLIALLLPFFGGGETVHWLGLNLSVTGLYGAWNIAAKGTLGVVSSLLLAATTPVNDLLTGLDRLRCPRVMTQIAGFMLRYGQVLGEEAARMRVARLSRGYEQRFLWQLRAWATGAGALFLRAFERGERVYVAMLSRGYAGVMPRLGGRPARPAEWAAALTLPAVTGAVALAAALT
ncbi:cobalt ECF transporter T component CbiQ [Actinorhabdospora filicis]|uniref:Cobalt ECF transporter T component CbiQ n=1 Tax=Actinorhabdospora filicis TaxID=1785913 RepID=A0A9W6STE7_9ACTN|nr:cobalt ECF transporter T component CbiQ [Actinorhabdospora filicis]GLZ82017.1 cobalt ECF transporter T component CbiQ [Actinorhabdospora filicis]